MILQNYVIVSLRQNRIISAKGSYNIPFGLPAILNIMPRPDIIAFRDLHNTWAYIGLWIIIIHASVALIEYYFFSRQVQS